MDLIEARAYHLNEVRRVHGHDGQVTERLHLAEAQRFQPSSECV